MDAPPEKRQRVEGGGTLGLPTGGTAAAAPSSATMVDAGSALPAPSSAPSATNGATDGGAVAAVEAVTKDMPVAAKQDAKPDTKTPISDRRDVATYLGSGGGRLELDLTAPSMRGAPPAAPPPAATDRVVYTSGSWEAAEAITRAFPRHAVPFTLLTGFLGAGKSTVLNYILRQPHGLRIAVLINELGEIDIDNQLVSATDVGEEDDVMELNNGCICCTISNSFIDAVQRILARFKDTPPDYLIVETTGVADPEPIMNAVQATELAEELYWDQVLTVVDASQFGDDHYGSETARKQVNSADTVLLSKTDLMTPEAVDAAVQRVINMKPNARILRSQRGQVPVAALFDLGMSLRRETNEKTVKGVPTVGAAAPAPKSAAVAGTAGPNGADKGGAPHAHASGDASKQEACDHDHGTGGHNHTHDHDHGAGGHNHTHDHGHAAPPTHLEREGFSTVSFAANKPFKLSTFRDFFVDTLPVGVFRAKGLLWFRHYPSRFLLQVSGKRFQMDQDLWPKGTAPNNQLVVIGRNLDRNALVASLEACLVEPLEDSEDDMTSDDEVGMLGEDPGMPPDGMYGGYGEMYRVDEGGVGGNVGGREAPRARDDGGNGGGGGAGAGGAGGAGAGADGGVGNGGALGGPDDAANATGVGDANGSAGQ